MPGANARALEKAKTIEADGLIFDLEDAVAPAAKAQAREQVAAAAASGDYGERVLAIRVNGIDTEWHDEDVKAAAAAGPDAIVVPKVGSVADVYRIESSLERAGAPDRTRIWAMLETPSAILHAEEIAAASARIEVLAIGTNDLAGELHTGTGVARSPLLASLSWCVLAARATGRLVLDGVYNDVRDSAGFEAECRQGAELGFDGKTLIHPSQVPICNSVYSPSEAEIEHAKRVIATFREAERSGSGVATVDGRMIENLHVANAERVLALAGISDIG